MNVAEFTVKYINYLDNEGKLLAKLPIDIDNKILLKLYKAMVLARVFDKKNINLQRTGKIGTYASALGQEAIGAAIGLCLNKDDVYVPSYRDYGALLLRNIKMEEILLYWGGDERGNNYANSAEDFPPAVPIATQCLHAAGVATAIKYKQQQRCSLVTVGDGGTSKGDFYEALNVAGVWQLPLVVVICNNKWAISCHRNLQTRAKTLAQKAIAAGIDCIQVDGNDSLALYCELSQAISNARDNYKPMVIEAITYRRGDHTTADDASRYRSMRELKAEEQNDPIVRLKLYLENNNLWDNNQDNQLVQECNHLVAVAVDNYLSTEPNKAEDMFNYLYQTLPDSYIEQRDYVTNNK